MRNLKAISILLLYFACSDCNTPMARDIAALKQHHIRINYCCTDDTDLAVILLDQGVDFILTDQLSKMLTNVKSAGIEPAHY